MRAEKEDGGRSREEEEGRGRDEMGNRREGGTERCDRGGREILRRRLVRAPGEGTVSPDDGAKVLARGRRRPAASGGRSA